MPTTHEKKALWFLALVALSGSAVRLWRASVPQATGAEWTALDHQIDRVDSVRAMRHQRRVAHPSPSQEPTLATAPAPRGVPIDLDLATAEEIEALPGIGPALSKRIVAARDSSGGFGQIEALCEVNGIGRALVERLRPLVTFTGARRPLSDACSGASKRPRKSRVVRSRQPR